jgi:hypothetical protein
MVFRKSKQSQGDIIFKVKVMALCEAIKRIMQTNDSKALKGIQGFSSFMLLNTALNNGSGIISYLIKETMKDYEDKKPLRKILLGDIKNAFPGFRKEKTDELLDGLEKFGFISYVFEPGTNPEFQRQKHPAITFIRLTDVWLRYLKEYKRKYKSDLFIESIGRLLWASILAYNGEASGVRSFKILVIILENVSRKGELSMDDATKYCYKMGCGRFAQLIAGDNGKAEEIRFFIDVDKEKVKVNENTLYVYHKYIIPISENIIREQGLVL